MNPGADASEQVFRMSLEGSEFAIKMVGKGLKNLLVAIYTIATSQERSKGKVRMTTLLKSGKQLKIYSIPQDDLGSFVQAAKKYGIMYSAIRTPKSMKDGTVDIMAKAEDAARINYIIEKYNLVSVSEKATIETEKQPEKSKALEQSQSKETVAKTDNLDDLVNEILDGAEKPDVQILNENEILKELFGDEPETPTISKKEKSVEESLDMKTPSQEKSSTSKKLVDVDVPDPIKEEIMREPVEVDVPDPIKNEIMADSFEYTVEKDRKAEQSPQIPQSELNLSDELEAEMNGIKNMQSLPSLVQEQKRGITENPTRSGQETFLFGSTSKKQSSSGLTQMKNEPCVRDTISDIKKERSKAAQTAPAKTPQIKIPEKKGR